MFCAKNDDMAMNIMRKMFEGVSNEQLQVTIQTIIHIIKKNIGQLADKKFAVFAGGASSYDKKAIMQIREMHFKNELRNIPLFYCRGAWDEEKMKFADRTLCKMLQKAVAKQNPDEYEPWQKALMCAVGQKCDWTDKSYLEPLLKYIEE